MAPWPSDAVAAPASVGCCLLPLAAGPLELAALEGAAALAAALLTPAEAALPSSWGLQGLLLAAVQVMASSEVCWVLKLGL